MAALIFGMIILWLGICFGLCIVAARAGRRQPQASSVPTEAQPIPVPQTQR